MCVVLCSNLRLLILLLVCCCRSGWGSRAPRSAPRPRCTPEQGVSPPMHALQQTFLN
ncbi:hypothetical protein PR003_g27697 [Phytophthora rubi]|uniref:RxLR effector protein n=1 Tax=Phytophthora rubi TaxID=129364 RepID=A0A6A4BW67_9STRA|nr:hypothetical protein PR001_g26695 [Phytophthora rubi]KAE9281348.1 hypothetical protein PR003_g27697 [Phytophthora rubi]